MLVRRFTVGKFFTNCYVAASERTKDAIIIDPGLHDDSDFGRVCKFVEANDLKVVSVVNTHGHPDHTCGNGIIRNRFGVPILIHEYDAYMLQKSDKIAGFFGLQVSSPPPDRILREGDTVGFGDTALEVMHTPGHSRGSISLLGEKEVFTGDTLFAGSIGRTDFPDSSMAEMRQSLRKLESLPVHFLAYPGHGPETTIGDEKDGNPFLQSL